MPAAQLDQSAQVAWLIAVVNLPASQTAQVRSAVAEPLLVMCSPAMQLVWETQVVAGLLSWSQVPCSHGTAGLVAPWQYCPGRQAVQTAGAVEVAAMVWMVPAGQSVAARHDIWFFELE